MTALFGIHPDMMILPMMYVGIGFLFAALIAVALSPAIHRRAERLTTRRLDKDTPLSVRELRAQKDHLRAKHAVAERDLEVGIDLLKEKLALQSGELGRKTETVHRLKVEVQEKSAALAELEQTFVDIDNGGQHILDDLHAAQFEVKASRVALKEAEETISLLQSDITELTAAVESRTRLIDRQQHDIMALTAQIDRITTTPPLVAPALAQAAAISSAMSVVRQTATQQIALQTRPVQPVAAAPAPMREPQTVQQKTIQPYANQPRVVQMVSFEDRLASIRDDKPLRDVRPDVIEKRKIEIEPAPVPASQKQPAAPVAAPANVVARKAEPAAPAPAATIAPALIAPVVIAPVVIAPVVQKVAAVESAPAPVPAPVDVPAAVGFEAAAAAAALDIAPVAEDTEPVRLATDIRYDEPLSTSDLLELGKAMLRQPAKDGTPHKTH